HRVADVGGGRDQVGVGESGPGDAGDDGHAEGRDGGLGGDLVAHDLDGTGGWAEEDDARLLQRGGEGGVLGQESVAGVHGLGTGAPRGVDHLVDVQIALPGRGGTEADGDIGLADVASACVGIAV